MNRCEVLIPFHMIATDTDHTPGDIIEIDDAQLAKIRAVNVNMVLVLPAEEPVEEPAEEPVETKPKKRAKKK